MFPETLARRRSINCCYIFQNAFCILYVLLAGSLSARGQVSFPQPSAVEPTIRPFRESDKRACSYFFDYNPSFFKTGRYTYTSGTTNHQTYPAVKTESEYDLSEYHGIQVVFDEYVPVGMHKVSGSIPSAESFIISRRQFDHLKYNSLKEKNKIELDDLNEFYKKGMAELLAAKKARTFTISDILDTRVAQSDSLSEDLRLEVKLDAFRTVTSKKRAWPDYTRYTLTVRSIRGEVVAQYHQIIFFMATKLEKTNANLIKATIIPAFESLLNQFLNDENAKQNLRELAKNQRSSSQNNYALLNKSQAVLLNNLYQKMDILKVLKDIGYNVDNLDFNTVSPNYVYNSSLSANTNQLISSSGQLLGNLILAGANAKRAKQSRKISGELIQEFDSLAQSDEEYIKSLDPLFAKSEAVLYLPANAEVNKLAEEVKAELIVKNNQAAQKLQNQRNSILTSDLTSVTTQISNSVAPPATSNGFGTPGTNAPGTQPDGNSPEAKACAQEADKIWKASVEYRVWERTNNLPSHQYRYDQVVQWKLIKIYLENCRQFFTPTEINAFEGELGKLKAQFIGNGGCTSNLEICITD